MKAWIVQRHGGPDVLKRAEIETPAPGVGQVLIRVHAVGLNHLDLWVRNGIPGVRFPLPLIPGCDVAGEIAEFGALSDQQIATMNLQGLKVGTPVVIEPVLSCGACTSCLSGSQPTCPQFGIIGETRNGGCADYAVVPFENVIKRPAEISATEAAALPIAYTTAWAMLFRKAKIQAGEWVLIQSAGSGVSIAAMQMAKMAGANVVATAGSDEKCQLALKWGADAAINYKSRPFAGSFRALLQERGIPGMDVAIDHVGMNTFVDSLKSLRWGGRLVTCGATTGSKVEIDLKPVFFKSLSIIGSTMSGAAELRIIVDLVRDRKIKAAVDTIYKMEDLPQAMARLESRTAFGKIVLTN